MQLSYSLFIIFFFSSRRRHTRLVSDWSSDVCSSDLLGRGDPTAVFWRGYAKRILRSLHLDRPPWDRLCPVHVLSGLTEASNKIGRASCRERVDTSADAASVKESKNNSRKTRRHSTGC